MADRTITLVHEDSGSKLVTVMTGTGDYVNIPGFTFHEPLDAYLDRGWVRA